MCVYVCVWVRASARARALAYVGVWVCGWVRACVRRARVCVRVRVCEYVGAIPYMDATFKVPRLAA